MEPSARPTSTLKGGKDKGEGSTSEEYPGCYGDDSDDWKEEEEDEDDGMPLPTREELIVRIRDRPFNETQVCMCMYM